MGKKKLAQAMTIEIEQVERVIITVADFDDKKAMQDALDYCESHGYEVVYRNPVRESISKLSGEYRIVAEKDIVPAAEQGG